MFSFQNPLFVDLFGTCHTEQVKPGIEKLLLLPVSTMMIQFQLRVRVKFYLNRVAHSA